MKYKVDIIETLMKTIEVEAETKEQAEEIIRSQYNNEEIVLTADDYCCTDLMTYAATD